jgi:hypothetical protein
MIFDILLSNSQVKAAEVAILHPFSFVRFEVLAAATLDGPVLWDVKLWC